MCVWRDSIQSDAPDVLPDYNKDRQGCKLKALAAPHVPSDPRVPIQRSYLNAVVKSASLKQVKIAERKAAKVAIATHAPHDGIPLMEGPVARAADTCTVPSSEDSGDETSSDSDVGTTQLKETRNNGARKKTQRRASGTANRSATNSHMSSRKA